MLLAPVCCWIACAACSYIPYSELDASLRVKVNLDVILLGKLRIFMKRAKFSSISNSYCFAPALTIFPWAYGESNFQHHLSVGALFCRDCAAMKRRKYDHKFQHRNITNVSLWWIGTSGCNWTDPSTCTYQDSSSYHSCQGTIGFRVASDLLQSCFSQYDSRQLMDSRVSLLELSPSEFYLAVAWKPKAFTIYLLLRKKLVIDARQM